MNKENNSNIMKNTTSKNLEELIGKGLVHTKTGEYIGIVVKYNNENVFLNNNKTLNIGKLPEYSAVSTRLEHYFGGKG